MTRSHHGQSIRDRRLQIHNAATDGEYSEPVVLEQTKMRFGIWARRVVDDSEEPTGGVRICRRTAGTHICRHGGINEYIAPGAQNPADGFGSGVDDETVFSDPHRPAIPCLPTAVGYGLECSIS